MRVTNSMMINNLMRNLNKNLGRMDHLQQKMASGKQFIRPSDDPIGVSRSLRLNTEVATMEQYRRNTDDTQSWLDTTEIALNNIASILHRANELTVQAASETNSIDERNAIASEIKELRNQLVQIGNASYAGSYIFSGYKTDKALFDSDGKYYLGGGTTRLTLDEVIETNIGLKDRMAMNLVGQRVFGLYNGIDVDDLDMKTVDTLMQRQSMKGVYTDLSIAENTINAPAPGLNFTISNGVDSQAVNITGTFDDLNVLAAAIKTELNATPFDEPNVYITVQNSRLVFESNTVLTLQSGTADPADPVFDVSLMGMTNNQTSVSRVDPGNQSQLIAIFDQLISDLEDDNTEGVNSGISRIGNQASNINAIRSEIGVKSNRAELTINRILDDTLNLKGLLSKNEDADIAEVIMKVKMEENVYQASLSTGARIIQPSLIDFLR